MAITVVAMAAAVVVSNRYSCRQWQDTIVDHADQAYSIQAVLTPPLYQ